MEMHSDGVCLAGLPSHDVPLSITCSLSSNTTWHAPVHLLTNLAFLPDDLAHVTRGKFPTEECGNLPVSESYALDPDPCISVPTAVSPESQISPTCARHFGSSTMAILPLSPQSNA